MSFTQTDLMMMEIGDLRKIAESYQIKTAGQSRDQLLEAVQVAAIRKTEDLQQKVVEAKRAEALLKIGVEVTGKKRPSAENIAILASKKVRVRFLNREDGGGAGEVGADVTFLKGSFRFHLYDGQEHLLPECLIVESIDEIPNVLEKVVNFFVATGMKKGRAEDTAKGVLRRMSLYISCRNPVYADVKLPGGETVSKIVQWIPRFDFKISKQDVPEHADFGPVEREVQHA